MRDENLNNSDRFRPRGGNTEYNSTEIMNNFHDDRTLTSDSSQKKPLQEEATNFACSGQKNKLVDFNDNLLPESTIRTSVNDRHKYFVPDEVMCFDDDGNSIASSNQSYVTKDQLTEHVNNIDVSNAEDQSQQCKDQEKLCDKSSTTVSAHDERSFLSLRVHYLIVTLVIMLADGLQGTHLYVLYEGYGFSVASLYCLGFVTGGIMSPITGPLVDKLGRKKSALLYCFLEVVINKLEQYPLLPGLIFSRMVGGVTTNLLSTVFETWLDTEYRRRGFDKDKYEIIMRDSVIVSNLAAIGSGYLAHILADRYGPVGPFEGAVTCTSLAFIVVMFVWTENYGSEEHEAKGATEFLKDAITAFKSDNKVVRVGVIQGLTCASIQIFIFLWSPALRHFAMSAPGDSLGLDSNGEPAYGLIFGSFMACGVLGGLAAPWIRKNITKILCPYKYEGSEIVEGQTRPMSVEFLATGCYFLCAALLLIPCMLPADGSESFSICLAAFLFYEILIGVYLPCEGVIRSIYFPSEGRASIMTLPRIIVNVAVSLGVITTNFITMRSAFSSLFILMTVSGCLQLSLISRKQWSMLRCRFGMWQDNTRSILQSIVNFCTRADFKNSASINTSLKNYPIQNSPNSTNAKFLISSIDDASIDENSCESIESSVSSSVPFYSIEKESMKGAKRKCD